MNKYLVTTRLVLDEHDSPVDVFGVTLNEMNYYVFDTDSVEDAVRALVQLFEDYHKHLDGKLIHYDVDSTVKRIMQHAHIKVGNWGAKNYRTGMEWCCTTGTRELQFGIYARTISHEYEITVIELD